VSRTLISSSSDIHIKQRPLLLIAVAKRLRLQSSMASDGKDSTRLSYQAQERMSNALAVLQSPELLRQAADRACQVCSVLIITECRLWLRARCISYQKTRLLELNYAITTVIQLPFSSSLVKPLLAIGSNLKTAPYISCPPCDLD
jgi:hypothetical protein